MTILSSLSRFYSSLSISISHVCVYVYSNLQENVCRLPGRPQHASRAADSRVGVITQAQLA